MHPLFALLATRPQLLTDHAQAYAALLTEEFRLARTQWRKAVIWQALALTLLGATMVLVGVALMLWAVTPASQIHTPWLLVFTPVMTFGVGIGCQWAACKQSNSDAFANLSRQISADLTMLRAVAPL